MEILAGIAVIVVVVGVVSIDHTLRKILEELRKR
jgi:hypothetical protein